MTGNAQKQIFRYSGLIAVILLLCGISLLAAQEEKISPLSNYQYNKRDYPRYQEIMKETNPQKKADLLLAFIKERPISKLLLNAVTEYLECMKPQLQRDKSKAVPTIEGLMALLPTEQTIKAAQIPVGVEEFEKEQLQPSRKLLMKSLFAAYYQMNNYPKAAETLEKVYAMEPDKSLLPVLADLYLKFNQDKYLSYARKILAGSSVEKEYKTALTMAQIYIKKQDIKSAADLFGKVMDVYGDRVPPGYQESTWNATRAFAYGVLATVAYENNKDDPKVMDLFQKVVRFDPKRDDAYYYIGLTKWRKKDQLGAIDSFAKCVVLNKKNTAAKAKQYMEQLYKAEHNDSLDGIDDVLAKAKSELGIR